MSRALLVRGGFVYTADEHDTVHPTGSVLAVDGMITAVGELPDAQLPSDVVELDAAGMMVLPGFVNNHWHEMFAVRAARRPPHDRDDAPGVMAHGGDIPALSAMFDTFTDLPDRLTDEEADAIARYSLWTQLRSGTTTVGDTGSVNRPDRIVTAASTLGIRCSVSTWASDVVCPPGEHRYRRTRDADTVLADIEDLLRRHETGPDPLIRVRPSALYVTNLSPELGHGLRDLADRYDTPLAVHAGALRNEPEAVRTYFGTTPIRRLAELGLLTDRLTAIHSAFVDDEERKLMVEAGVHISHSPAKYGSSGESTMSETRAIPELMRAGLDVSLSTDGSVFPIGAMPEAMRAAWQQHNELAADPAAVRPTTALAMATRVAARSLRWADEIGSLTPGKQADLVLVPADDWRYMGTPRPLEAFLALGGSADVHTVIVAGRIRVRDGQPVDFDERELCRTYTDALRSFAERSG